MTGRAARLAGDLRALGAGAPFRAGDEASKRLGGHALVSRAVRRRAGPAEASRPVFRFPEPPPEAARRAREEADRIASGNVVLFGRSVVVADRPEWHAVIDGPDEWPRVPWWKVDLRSHHRPGDVKWAWELGRHRHLVTLARACATPDPDPAWAETLDDHLSSWIDQNPPEIGVHWASNLEIALRAVAWLEIVGRAGDVLPPELRAALDRHLRHAGHHLVADLPYTLSTMRNNHVLGDAVGLVALGLAFGDDPAARRWHRLGDRLLARYVPRIVFADGAMTEDSVSYHRFVVELLSVRVLLGRPAPGVVRRLTAAAQFLCRLGVEDGEVPQYGDWDEGRAVTATGDPHDLRGSARLALALVGRGAPEHWRTEHDEVGWWARPGEPLPPEPAQDGGHDVGGGMARAHLGPFRVWLKAGGGSSHGHADRCSVAIREVDPWVVGDPGTGSYNGDARERDFLRSSCAHAVVSLDGQDQLVPHRNFRWRHTATGRVGPPVRVGETVVLWGAHDAYRRLTPARRIARTVVLHADGLEVRDWIEGPTGVRHQLTVPLPPKPGPSEVVGPPGTRIAESLWSATYGEVQPSERLVHTGSVDGSLTWQVGSPPAVAVSVEWGDGLVALVVGDLRSELVL